MSAPPAESPSTERLSLILTAVAGFFILVVGGIALYFTWQNQRELRRVPLVAPPTAVPTPVPTPTPTPYVHAEGFSITPPLGWTEATGTGESAPDPTAKITFVNPVPDTEGGTPFPATLAVYAIPASGLTLNGSVTSAKQDLPRTLAKFTLIDDAMVRTAGGDPAYMLGGTFQGGLRLKELIVVKNDTLYIVTGIALTAPWESKNYNALFDTAFTSLTVPGSTPSPSAPSPAR